MTKTFHGPFCGAYAAVIDELEMRRLMKKRLLRLVSVIPVIVGSYLIYDLSDLTWVPGRFWYSAPLFLVGAIGWWLSGRFTDSVQLPPPHIWPQ